MTVVVVSGKTDEKFEACGEPCPENPEASCHKHYQHYGTHIAQWPGKEPGTFDGNMWETKA